MSVCIACEGRPPRTLPDRIPEGTPVMFTEAIAGQALYCQECFDGQDDA